MPIHAYLADSILSHGIEFKDSALLTDGGKVKAIVPKNEIPKDCEVDNFGNAILAAGLVDAQVNGGGGMLFNNSTSNQDHIKKIADAHLRFGTTAFLPTLISDDTQKIPEAVAAIKKAKEKQPTNIVGLHLEGPFLNTAKKGIHTADKIEKADSTILNTLNPQDVGTLLITLAPEKIDPSLIHSLTQKGALISAGHSLCDETALVAAKQAGLTGVTHLFNAMGSLNAREPNLAGLALVDDDLFCSIICDNAHVSPAMIKLACKAKPENKLFLVSDAMPPAAQTPPQNFSLQGQTIFARNGRCEDAGGRLAGAAITLFECMQIAVKKMGIALPRAHAMASYIPAQFLKLDKTIGSLQPNKNADFFVFDRDFTLRKIVLNGAFVD